MVRKKCTGCGRFCRYFVLSEATHEPYCIPCGVRVLGVQAGLFDEETKTYRVYDGGTRHDGKGPGPNPRRSPVRSRP